MRNGKVKNIDHVNIRNAMTHYYHTKVDIRHSRHEAFNQLSYFLDSHMCLRLSWSLLMVNDSYTSYSNNEKARS